MDRKVTLISPEIGQLLLTQLAHELNNHNLYMSFAAYFGREGLTKLEEYYRKRAAEEYKHHQWIVDYLIEGDFDFVYPEIKAVTQRPKNYLEPFSLTTEREIETTQLIYKIKDLSVAQKDYMTEHWLQKLLIDEQVEEENTSRMAESIAELEGDCWIVKADAVLDLLEN